ncbi:MAG: hypothetical protein IKN91_07845 [Paludibacteraceae bacterium]|nr:hypothetical protein [Paludibacteraceae bacterium]
MKTKFYLCIAAICCSMIANAAKIVPESQYDYSTPSGSWYCFGSVLIHDGNTYYNQYLEEANSERSTFE